MSERTVPYNVDAERAVLGAVMIDPRIVLEVQAVLRPEDFYTREHRWVYEGILSIERRGGYHSVDFLTLTTELERVGRLEAVGGAVYISQLLNAVPSAYNARQHAVTVAECAVRRQMLDVVGDIARMAHDEQAELSEVITAAEARLYSVRRDVAQSRLRSAADASSDLYDYLEQINTGTVDHGLPTGYPELDAIIRLRRGEMTTIGGRPGQGKTSLLLCIALKAAFAGAGVLFFSAEMPLRQLWMRAIKTTGVTYEPPGLSSDQFGNMADNLARLGDLRMWIDDTSRINPVEMRSRAVRVAAEQRVDLVVVDYVQLLRPPPYTSKQNRYEQVGETARAIRDIARELDCHALTGAQIGRQSEGREPRLSDLRESGDLEQDSDNVLFIHPLDGGANVQKLVDIVVAKQRQGRTGRVTLAWHPERTAFTPISRKSYSQETST